MTYKLEEAQERVKELEILRKYLHENCVIIDTNDKNSNSIKTEEYILGKLTEVIDAI